ncbi:MAG: ABC transporter permease [Candidatus Moranbacteria bacterium]|nr:ABC transporter permease [Candidatus Moranbacteria bacterium]
MRDFKVPIKLAVKNLRSNVGRTILTLFGVVIGITSVIVISSSGQGVKSYILGQISSFGTDMIQVEIKVPNTGKDSTANAMGQATGIQITTMKEKDAEAIGKLGNVSSYYYGNMGQELVTYKNINKRAILFGTSAGAPAVDANIKLQEGSFFTEGEDKSLNQVVVIGADVAESFFSGESALGKIVKIKDKNFRVIGVLAKRGAVTFFNFDDLIYVPVRTLQKKILGVDYLRFISVKVKDEKLIDATVADITQTIRKEHDIKDPSADDFGVSSIKEAQDTITKVFGTINILLLFLTSISLLVGGVGIMNVMYVAVVERTFEIGLRKAVGARSENILKQFLLEAIFITFAGGIAGIILGFLFSRLLSYIFSVLGYDLQFIITWQALLLAVGFSIAVGIIFGYYPARQASRLSPMEALRKE